MSATHCNNYPKLHNAAWPGVVGKGDGGEPPIDLDTMLDLTAAAEVDGVKFDGFDLFLYRAAHRHRRAPTTTSRQLADKARGAEPGDRHRRGPDLAAHRRRLGDGRRGRPQEVPRPGPQGLPHRPAAARAGRPAATASCASTRPAASTPGCEDPEGNQKRIAETFREACTIAEDHGERLAAEGEICWGGMHSWRRMVQLLEMVDRPQTLGFQADMAHTLLYLLGYNAPEDAHPAAGLRLERHGHASTRPTRQLTAALRPWTIDFHVAQNDATVHGSGSHDKTGRHCLADRSQRQARHRRATPATGCATTTGKLTKQIPPHLLGRLHVPQRDDDEAARRGTTSWRAMIAVRDAHGWRNDDGRKSRMTNAISTDRSTTGSRIRPSQHPATIRRPSWPRHLNIGIIGCGFMGRAHSNAWLAGQPLLPARAQAGAQGLLRPAGGEGQAGEVRRRLGLRVDGDSTGRSSSPGTDIDLIDVCVPNDMHHDIVIAAAEAGKMVVCEKPLAMNVAEAEEMVAAVEKAGVANMVSFNYRRVPAIALAKQIIDEGRIGRPFHYRATYNQDYTISADVPQGGMALWRLDAKVAGSGVTGDLLAHSIDTAEWLNGPIAPRRRPTPRRSSRSGSTPRRARSSRSTIDDACMFLAVFANGSMGTFESTRYARGRKNYNTFELNGENGAVFFDLEDPHILQVLPLRRPDRRARRSKTT